MAILNFWVFKIGDIKFTVFENRRYSISGSLKSAILNFGIFEIGDSKLRVFKIGDIKFRGL